MTQAQVDARIAIEKRIVRKVLDDAIAAGFAISVDDGDGHFVLKATRDADEIMGAMFSMDQDTIYLHRIVDEKVVVKAASFVLFVYGNDGTDVVADHGTSITELMRGANDLADEIDRARGF